MTRSTTLSLLACALVLAGCAAKPAPQVTYPTHPTAVVKSTFVTSGGRLPDMRGTETVYTREDMRASAQELKFEGAVSRWLLPSGNRMTITRVDKNLSWYVDRKRKTYEECPLGGCADLLLGTADEESTDEPEAEAGAPACTTKLVRNAFTVKPTGQTRVVNGFQAEEYAATWTVVREDPKKNRDTNTVAFAIWTTPETPQIADALRMQDAFRRAYLARLGMSDVGLSRLVSAEAYLVLSQLIEGVTAEDRRAAARLAREMEKVKGFPVSVRTVWKVESKACPQARPAEARQEADGVDVSNGLAGLKRSLFRMAGDKAKDAAAKKLDQTPDKPLLDAVYEITSIGVEPVSDGVFELSPEYRLKSRK
ncbi:MAG TPA: hypothetical protein VF406_08990 [Thermodesulfobacteriota bacterium]